MITDSQGIKFLASAESELARVSHIAKQTLGYYREHASQAAQASAISRNTPSDLRASLHASGITLRKSFESSRKVMMRRGEMMQVISNLIMNSIYGSLSAYCSISVSDTEVPSEGSF